MGECQSLSYFSWQVQFHSQHLPCAPRSIHRQQDDLCGEKRGMASQLQILLLNIFSSPRPLLKESCRSVRLGTMRHWEGWEQMWGFLSCFPQQKHTGDHSALPVQKMVCPASEMLAPETAVPLHSIVRVDFKCKIEFHVRRDEEFEVLRLHNMNLVFYTATLCSQNC